MNEAASTLKSIASLSAAVRRAARGGGGTKQMYNNDNPPYGKKMAAVHFTTIPCESNAANRHTESHIFLRNSFLY